MCKGKRTRTPQLSSLKYLKNKQTNKQQPPKAMSSSEKEKTQEGSLADVRVR